MGGFTIFLLVIAVGLLIGLPFSLKSKAQHEEKLRELRKSYSEVKNTGDPKQVIPAAQSIIIEVRLRNPFGLASVAEEIYRDMLSMLKVNTEFKPFALEMGRLAYGSKRKDRNPTIYDEQAILNDINAHV